MLIPFTHSILLCFYSSDPNTVNTSVRNYYNLITVKASIWGLCQILKNLFVSWTPKCCGVFTNKPLTGWAVYTGFLEL